MRTKPWLAGLALVLLALVILGYHPYAEDGGIYLAEIKRTLDPTLYPNGAAFVTGHLGPSFFADAVAFTTRITRLPLLWVIVCLHAGSVAALLFGVWRIAVLCYSSRASRAGAVGLVALALGMPIAGTSLMLMDPYLTARGVASALVVLGLSCLLRNERAAALAALATAVLLHPLMGAFGAAQASVLVCLLCPRQKLRALGALALAAFAAAFVLQRHAPPESAAYAHIASTRFYWFLSQWHWYERIGLAAPIAILAWVARRGSGPERTLARMAVFVGALSLVIALAFAHEIAPTHALARLQPLRAFHLIYLLLLVVLGAAVGERLLRTAQWRWAAAALALAGGMFAVQRATYPASNHLELPGAAPRNSWEQAFLWISRNTPKDALFALDADYVHRPGEDAHGFRALAERSALPDYSKDGGQASIRPELTPAWVAGQTAQAHLTQESDAERLTALHGTGVSWLVLGAEAATRLPCPYRNAAVMVCRLPPP